MNQFHYLAAQFKKGGEKSVLLYRESLRKTPLPTKAVTSMIIGLIGEMVSSYIKRKYKGVKSPFKLTRFLVFAIYGLFVSGPTFHFWYAWLENMSLRFPEKLRIYAKVAIDRLLFTPPFLLFTMGFLQYLLSFNGSQALEAVKKSYGIVLLTNWKVWTLVQYVNQGFVPLEYRVLFGNFVALWWNAYLSFNS